MNYAIRNLDRWASEMAMGVMRFFLKYDLRFLKRVAHTCDIPSFSDRDSSSRLGKRATEGI